MNVTAIEKDFVQKINSISSSPKVEADNNDSLDFAIAKFSVNILGLSKEKRIEFVNLAEEISKTPGLNYSSETLDKVVTLALKYFSFLPSTYTSDECDSIKIDLFRTIESESYRNRALALWIERKEIPLNTLDMSFEEIKRLASVLTRFIFSNNKFNESQICEILSAAKNCKEINLNKVDLTGELFVQLKFNHLECLQIEDCLRFNAQLPDMPTLLSLQLKGCPSFNKNLPEMVNLNKLVLNGLTSFNCNFPKELPYLKTFMFLESPLFDSDLPNMQQVEEIKLMSLQKFNKTLQDKPALLILTIQDLPEFNQTIEFSRLTNLLLIKLPSLQKAMVNMKERPESLIQLNVINCSQIDDYINQTRFYKLS
jgi:hypothetical protein